MTNCSACSDVITAIWKATDCHGNTALCHQIVTLVDIILGCSSDKTVLFGTPWTFDTPTAQVGSTGAAVPVTISGTVTNVDCPQTITRTWTATDPCGNSIACSQTVTVLRPMPLAVTFVPTNVLVCASNGCGLMPDVTGLVQASSSNGTVQVAQSIPPGQMLCTNTLLTFTLTDGCGNTSNRTTLAVVAPCCVEPARGMVLWLTMDETAGLTCLNSMGGNNGVRSLGGSPAPNGFGPTRTLGQYVNNSLCFTGTFVGDGFTYGEVVVPDYAAINFGTGDFSMDAWVKWAGANGTQVILDKRGFSGPTAFGYDLFLSNGQPTLEFGDGQLVQYAFPVLLSSNAWMHLAVTVQRQSPDGVKCYTNGVLAQSFAPPQHRGSVTNTRNLWVGNAFNQAAPFIGCLDELELFSRALRADEVAGLYAARTRGKCRPTCSLPSVASVCSNSVTLTAYVCNNGAFPIDCAVHFRTVSALECGLPHAVDWPPLPGLPSASYFASSPLIVHVLPKQCTPVTVTITRPAGLYDLTLFGAHKVACYEMDLFTLSSGERFSCTATLRDGALECPPIVFNPGHWTNLVYATNIVAKGTTTYNLDFRLTNPTNTVVTVHPQFVVFDDHLLPETDSVSLNGLPPGTPVTNQLTLGPLAAADLAVAFKFTTVEPGRTFYLVLLADIGENGELVPLASLALMNVNPPTIGPALDIAATNGQALLSWDLVNADFFLESVSRLGTTNWVPVSIPPIELPDARQGVIVPLTNSGRFFRLRQ